MSHTIDVYKRQTLINQYYTAYAAGDTDTLSTIATPLSENEKSYISVFSQYVDAYQNIKCYTKQGLDASSYLVSVYVEVKFKDVDTVAPGLDFFYVRTNEDGSVYIDNLYSQYNLKIKENALDTSIQNLISEYEDSEDVNTLQKEVQGKYDTAIASDDKLSEMISTTIPNAITEWAGTIVSQNTDVYKRQALEMTGKVITEKYPEYADAFEQLVNGRQTYFGNILVTSKILFDEYASWLFSIFFEVAERIELETGEDAYHKRVFGFISEFLLLVWVTVKKLRCV